MWLAVSVAVHLAMLILFIARPDWWWAAAAIVAANHLLLVIASLLPRSRWLGPNLTRLPIADARAVAVTFDDGPDAEVTPEVLRILAACGAQASFFCIAERAQAHPDLIRAMIAAGHHVENHSHGHPWYFAFMGPRRLGREIARAQAALTALAGTPPRYFRAPAGMRNPWLGFALARQGLHLASWTRRGFDTVSRDPERILARLTENLKAGDILLLHDGSAARDRNGDPTALSVLPRLLERLARENLSAVALPSPAALRADTMAKIKLTARI